jgi:citrate lyase subunit beta/citryl-CoA lyase
MLAKASSVPADAVLVDLEDGVPPDAKTEARDHVRRAFADGAFPVGRWGIRVNGVGHPEHASDLDLVAETTPPFAVLPKADDVDAVAGIAGTWAAHGTATGLMIETAAGVGRVRALAAAHPRVTALIVGSADLRLSLRARPDADRTWERHALGEVLLAARMHGCRAIDAVYFRFRDPRGLEREAAIARDLGFDGKSCIHPGQVATIHEVFSSTPEDLAWARAVLEAWRSGDGASRGVVVHDGEMIEALHIDLARRILERAPDR